MTNNIKLTKTQQKDLYDLYDKALNDLWDIWQTSALKSVFIPLNIGDDSTKKWHFRIDDKNIRLTCNTGYAHSISQTLAYSKKRFKKYVLIKNIDINQDLMFEFIKRYEYIRENLIKRLSSGDSIKKETDDLFSKLKEQFNKSSTIEIDFGNPNNLQTIEINEEEGKKIGTINFGSQTIKIITKGEITLVNKKTDKKIKRR